MIHKHISPIVWSMFNGELIAASEARLPVHDLGVLRGFSLFDFFRVLEQQPVFLDDHLERFQHSAKQMKLPLPYNKKELTAMIYQLIEQNQHENTGMVLLLTGGTALDGFTPSQPNLIIFQRPLPDYLSSYYDDGIKLITQRYRREFPTIKSTNYAMGVQLHAEMKEAGAVDILYHDGEHVTETTRSNIFIRRNNLLLTPDKDILKGITRNHVLHVVDEEEMIMMGLRHIELGEVYTADEVFITSSTKEVMPVTQVDDKIIGDGKVGELSKRILQAFRLYVKDEIGLQRMQRSVNQD